MSNARIQSAPRTAMELAWLKAAQRLATQKPKQPKPKPRKCLGDPGECDHNGACMYACGVPGTSEASDETSNKPVTGAKE